MFVSKLRQTTDVLRSLVEGNLLLYQGRGQLSSTVYVADHLIRVVLLRSEHGRIRILVHLVELGRSANEIVNASKTGTLS